MPESVPDHSTSNDARTVKHHAMSFRSVLEADLRVYEVPLAERPSFLRVWKHTLSMVIFSPAFACTFWYRVNRWLYLHAWPGSRLLGAWRYYRFGNDISCQADIGPGLRICHTSDIVIGGNVKIGRNASIYNGVTLGGKTPQTLHIQPSVGDDVFIGTGAKLLGGITIGDRVIVGALTFCSRDIPSDSTAYGNILVIQPHTPPAP